MRCRDLNNNMAAIELFATRKIDPAIRVKFAQRLLRLREAFRLLREEMSAMSRRHAKADGDGNVIYGAEDERGERPISIVDPGAYDKELRTFLNSELDVVVTAFGNELIEKTKEYTPTEVAGLITVGLLIVPEDTPPAPAVKEIEDE